MNEILFRKVMNESYGKVSGICLKYLGNRADACDLAQEVFVRVWMNLDKFRGDSNISTWIYSITRNVCLTSIKESKKLGRTLSDMSLNDTHDIEDEDSDSSQIQDAKLKFTWRYINKLSHGDKTLVNLYIDGFDTRGIASVTGLSQANVRTRIHRIKKQIKKEWENCYEIR